MNIFAAGARVRPRRWRCRKSSAFRPGSPAARRPAATPRPGAPRRGNRASLSARSGAHAERVPTICGSKAAAAPTHLRGAGPLARCRFARHGACGRQGNSSARASDGRFPGKGMTLGAACQGAGEGSNAPAPHVAQGRRSSNADVDASCQYVLYHLIRVGNDEPDPQAGWRGRHGHGLGDGDLAGNAGAGTDRSRFEPGRADLPRRSASLRSIDSPRSSRTRPNTVGIAPLRVRSNSGTPRERSSAAIPRVRLGCEIFISSAARAKLPWRPSAIARRMSRRSFTIASVSQARLDIGHIFRSGRLAPFFDSITPNASAEASRDGSADRSRERNDASRRLCLSGCVLLADIASAQTATRPNILVIWGDDIGWQNVSAYGMGTMGYTTPNIDRIGMEGVRFTDHYAQPSCTAGRAAFITGQYPIRSGMTTVGSPATSSACRQRRRASPR